MTKKFYCPNCEKEQDSKIITKEETLNVKGQNITCCINVRICSVCKEEIIDEELDNISLQHFYTEYRRLNNLLQPEEIKSIREKYKLSQTAFAKLLGFGEKTITRYENGSIQDVAHDNLIRLMSSVNAFKKIWNLHKNKLTAKENKNLGELLNSFDENQNTNCLTWESSNIYSYTQKTKSNYCLKYKTGGFNYAQ